jgi:hypothetical protein
MLHLKPWIAERYPRRVPSTEAVLASALPDTGDLLRRAGA